MSLFFRPLSIKKPREKIHEIANALSEGLPRASVLLLSLRSNEAASPTAGRVEDIPLYLPNQRRKRKMCRILIKLFQEAPYGITVAGDDTGVGSAAVGRIAFDPATLEVSLAFAKYENGDVDSDWKDTIARLYDPSTFLKPPEPALQQHKREWLWNCVRQLRTIALSGEEPDGTREYQTAIAFVLLRRMIYPSDKHFPESRFAVGYLIAESLLLNLASEAGI